MNENMHTQEPWWNHGVMIKAKGNIPAQATSEKDARRIVACVNACAGISTADLENTQRNSTPPGFLAAKCKEADWQMEQALRLKSERDELLEALTQIAATSGGLASDIAVAAIAKVTGGAV